MDSKHVANDVHYDRVTNLVLLKRLNHCPSSPNARMPRKMTSETTSDFDPRLPTFQQRAQCTATRMTQCAICLAFATKNAILTFQNKRLSCAFKKRIRHAGEHTPPQKNFPVTRFLKKILWKWKPGNFCAVSVTKFAGHQRANLGSNLRLNSYHKKVQL